MNIFGDYKAFSSLRNTSLSIGMFDGVHLGHMHLIKQVMEKARAKDLAPTLLTFEPHPRLFFNPDDTLLLLNTHEEKISLIRRLGIEHLIFQPFDENFSQFSGQEFITEVVVQHLKTRHIVIGHDHVFGKNKSGNFQLFEKLAPQYHYTLEKARAIEIKGEIISSTLIRNALIQGDIKKANTYLGYDYFLTGKVIHGKKIGRTIGYPTANVSYQKHKLLPKFGAYIAEVYWGDDFFPAMISIGNNPTFNAKQTTVEAHLLDFEGDLYGKEITIVFKEFLHDQIKFSSVADLIQCLNEDKAKTRAFFMNHPCGANPPLN